MNDLKSFLSKHDVSNVTEVIKLSGRLSEFPITIKAITGPENSEYQKLCVENPNNPKKRSFNNRRYNELIVINHVVDPSFKDADWLKEMGCASPTQLLYKTLLAGEIQELSEKILKLSGFNDVEEDVEEVKN